MGRLPKPKVEYTKKQGGDGPPPKKGNKNKQLKGPHQTEYGKQLKKVVDKLNENRIRKIPPTVVVEIIAILCELIAGDGGIDIVKHLFKNGKARTAIRKWKDKKNRKEI